MDAMKHPLLTTIRVLTVAVVFFCTVQALCWPLIPKTGYRWWQLKWAAQVGEVVGFPVVALTLVFPFDESVSTQQAEFILLVAVLWAVLFWFMPGCCRPLDQRCLATITCARLTPAGRSQLPFSTCSRVLFPLLATSTEPARP
jgi:hypothetical protein